VPPTKTTSPRKKPPLVPAPNRAYTRIVNALTKERGVTVVPGWGAGNLVLKVRAKIFVILSSSGFVAKLPKARVDELVAEGHGTRFDPRKNGRVMKEWIVAKDESLWLALAREALAFVR
jgi:hypothetical protein